MTQTSIELILDDDSVVTIDTRVNSTIVPAEPGRFVLELLPLPGGGFDAVRFLRTRVIAWRIDRGAWTHPIVSGAAVSDRWTVLRPDGFVIPDNLTAAGYDHPPRVQDWMKDEICWMEDDVNSTPDFATPWEAIFRWGGPISKAILTMMAWRTDDFIGSPEEFLKRLSAYRGRRDELPSNPFVLAATAIAQSEAVLADVGIVVERIDDGRIRVGRRASPRLSFSIGSAPKAGRS